MAAFISGPSSGLLRHTNGQRVLASCARRRLLATLPEATAPPLILLLDLDETLLRPKLQRVHANRKLASVDFRIIIDGSINCAASLRPGLSEFFAWIRARQASGHIIGPWIFGQGAKQYIKPVIHQLDPKKEVFGGRILAKDKCTKLRQPWPWVLKSFYKVPEKGLGASSVSDCEELSDLEGNFPRMVLVDNNVMSSILHPENTLIIRDWEGDGKEDTELARVAAKLDAIILADLADGATGNYQKHLVQLTPGFDKFKATVAGLHARMKKHPDPDRELKEVLVEAWQEACSAKRELLGLGPGEV